MHIRIEEVLNHFAKYRQELREAVAGVPAKDQAVQPTPESWSVAGVLEHVALVETAAAGLLKAKISEGRKAGVGPETETSAVVNLRQVAKVQDRSYRIAAGEASQPKSNLDPTAALEASERAYDAVRSVVLDADGLALGEISAPHRVFGSLNLYEWITFLGSHESRHAAQIREIGAALAGGGGG